MKEINNYLKSFNGSEKKLDFLRYGLFNERGSIIDNSPKKRYKEEALQKIEYNDCKQNNLRK